MEVSVVVAWKRIELKYCSNQDPSSHYYIRLITSTLWLQDKYQIGWIQITPIFTLSLIHKSSITSKLVYDSGGGGGLFLTQYWLFYSDDLPTFSSNAIEASFHNLPDSVGDCFIYLNDDMFFANEVSPSDFWTPRQGQILFKSTWTAPPPASRMGNIWHRSIHNSNQLLDKLWGHAPERNYASHGPYFFSLKVLRHIFNLLPHEFNVTTAHPFRHEGDVSIPFLYNQFANHYYKSVVADKTINSYLKVRWKLPCYINPQMSAYLHFF